jgi:membrane protease YdiL (CAAX protease family)
MRAFVRSLSFGAEFSIVVLVAFGLPVISSFLLLYGLLFLADIQPFDIFSPLSQYTTCVIELVQLSAIAVFLRWRGWRFQDLHPEVSLNLTIRGIVLVLGYYAIYFNMAIIFMNVFPSIGQFTQMFVNNLGKPDLYSAALLTLINPVFEEVLVAGYVITALKEKKGVHFAINISVGIRLLYHLYQGPLAALSIIPMGLLFAYVYAKTERLWPLIVAHAVQDFVAFVSMM